MALEKISLAGFTDEELTKELARRKAYRRELEVAERESRSHFLFESLNELEALVSPHRDEDDALIAFFEKIREDGYWDDNYNVELMLVKYPPLD